MRVHIVVGIPIVTVCRLPITELTASIASAKYELKSNMTKYNGLSRSLAASIVIPSSVHFFCILDHSLSVRIAFSFLAASLIMRIWCGRKQIYFSGVKPPLRVKLYLHGIFFFFFNLKLSFTGTNEKLTRKYHALKLQLRILESK